MIREVLQNIQLDGVDVVEGHGQIRAAAGTLERDGTVTVGAPGLLFYQRPAVSSNDPAVTMNPPCEHVLTTSRSHSNTHPGPKGTCDRLKLQSDLG